MRDKPAYELQITQLAIMQMIIVIFKNSYKAYKFALAVKFHINYITGVNTRTPEWVMFDTWRTSVTCHAAQRNCGIKIFTTFVAYMCLIHSRSCMLIAEADVNFRDAPIIGIGRLSAYWPIIGIGHLTIGRSRCRLALF
jgi:hypothetical protein